MKVRFVVALSSIAVSLAALTGCAAGQKEVKAPETDSWAGYRGTYASSAPQAAGDPAKVEKKIMHAEPEASKAQVEEPSVAAPPRPNKKKSSKGMITGESVSSIGVDSLATALGTSLKAKVVSQDLTVGPKYELVQVQLKGQSVQIVRPAASPDPTGLAIPSPTERNGEMSTTESGWYDADADVLVIVNASKKASSQSSLGTILEK